ncbi:MAG: YbhB/YbcL family Raf kinase inhibitor-like protein [Syntrophales bacterium]|nr:YbhB/YbcL family Raf kinase inhibitor-like protein [Syntrophales bacterium]
MYLRSTAFKHGDLIPPKYTCDGENISPPLEWGNIPANTKSFVLICDDPDAPKGTWVHWVVYNIPANVRKLEENIPARNVLPVTGAKHGLNSWAKIGYGGPCPPSGTHRYFFKIYALDAVLDLGPGATKNDVLQSMKGKVLSEAILMGRYSRKK